MIEIAGTHQGVTYDATYLVDGEQTGWRATFQHGDEEFSREGRLIHGWMEDSEVQSNVHGAIQAYIDRMLMRKTTGAPVSRHLPVDSREDRGVTGSA